MGKVSNKNTNEYPVPEGSYLYLARKIADGVFASRKLPFEAAIQQIIESHTDQANPHSQYATQAAFADHAGDTGNPHGVTAAQVGADPAGTAASALSAHEGASNPHPQYSTKWAEYNNGDDPVTAPEANFTNALALGDGAAAGATYAFAFLGEVTGADGLAIGRFTESGNSSVAIGINAKSPGGDAVALGKNAVCNSGVAIGANCEASGGVALGFASTTQNADCIAIGSNADSGSIGGGGIAIGKNSVCASSGIAIGSNAASSTNNSLAIGPYAKTNNYSNVIAIGYNAECVGGSSIAIGDGASTTGSSTTRGIAIGEDATSRGVAIGADSAATGTDGIAIGRGASATTGVAMGRYAVSSGGNAQAYGFGANASGAASIVFGQGTATGLQGIAFGSGSAASHTKSVAISGKTQCDAQIVFGSATGGWDGATAGTPNDTDVASSLMRFRETTDATPTNIAQVILPTAVKYARVVATVLAHEPATGAAYTETLTFLWDNISHAIVGTVDSDVVKSTGALTVSLAASADTGSPVGTPNKFCITATGEAGKTIRWVSSMQMLTIG